VSEAAREGIALNQNAAEEGTGNQSAGGRHDGNDDTEDGEGSSAETHHAGRRKDDTSIPGSATGREYKGPRDGHTHERRIELGGI